MDAAPKRPGKEFERIVAAIHRQFAGDAQVTENAKIIGKSGQPRQIDIAIRTAVNGVYPILVAVECKDYARPVGIDDVDELIGKIDDVQAVTGILVSNSGFTEDAQRRAAQDVRIQLASVVDVESEAVRTNVAIPVICDFRAPEYRVTVRGTGTKQFTADASFWADVQQRFLAKWNGGVLDPELGEHECTEVLRDEPDLRIIVTHKYRVKRRLFFGRVKLVRGTGIVNVMQGTFSTSGFTLDVIDVVDVQEHWQRVAEDNIPFAVLTIEARDMFVILSSP